MKELKLKIQLDFDQNAGDAAAVNPNDIKMLLVMATDIISLTSTYASL